MDWPSDVRAISALLPGEPVDTDHVTTTGTGELASAFEVSRLLATSALHSVAAADGFGDRSDHRVIDLDQIAAYCTTHVEVDGESLPAWADLSGVYPTADGRHIQLHCNFPHHARGVVDHLGTSDDRTAVAAAIAERNAFELETALIERGMIGATIRTLDEWDRHPHAVATSSLPLVDVEQIGDADPRPAGEWSDVRVLDCSRVLAGPVSGSMLAGFGADVLRLGAEHLPSVPVGVISTGFGKRNTFVDLRTPEGSATVRSLFRQADVWIDAFRPGAMAALGCSSDAVAEQSPGVVIIQISAFDDVGPWSGRRGFDSILQSTTGVRAAGGAFARDSSGNATDPGPTGLPVQALDYATGFLAAGVAAQLLSHQRRTGGSWLARVSLLRTRNWLMGLGGPHPYVPTSPTVERHRLDSLDTDFGLVTAVRPFAGEWHHAPMPLGTSKPVWRL